VTCRPPENERPAEASRSSVSPCEAESVRREAPSALPTAIGAQTEGLSWPGAAVCAVQSRYYDSATSAALFYEAEGQDRPWHFHGHSGRHRGLWGRI
jgi:hypothetical protein